MKQAPFADYSIAEPMKTAILGIKDQMRLIRQATRLNVASAYLWATACQCLEFAPDFRPSAIQATNALRQSENLPQSAPTSTERQPREKRFTNLGIYKHAVDGVIRLHRVRSLQNGQWPNVGRLRLRCSNSLTLSEQHIRGHTQGFADITHPYLLHPKTFIHDNALFRIFPHTNYVMCDQPAALALSLARITELVRTCLLNTEPGS